MVRRAEAVCVCLCVRTWNRRARLGMRCVFCECNGCTGFYLLFFFVCFLIYPEACWCCFPMLWHLCAFVFLLLTPQFRTAFTCACSTFGKSTALLCAEKMSPFLGGCIGLLCLWFMLFFFSWIKCHVNADAALYEKCLWEANFCDVMCFPSALFFPSISMSVCWNCSGLMLCICKFFLATVSWECFLFC